LTATTNLFEQFVIAQFSQQLGSTRCFFVLRRSILTVGTNISHTAGVAAPGYNIGGDANRGFQDAAGTKSFWCVGQDFRAAISANSDYRGHFSESNWWVPSTFT
jgi:hypothetical protein